MDYKHNMWNNVFWDSYANFTHMVKSVLVALRELDENIRETCAIIEGTIIFITIRIGK
jgi:hypothetical protein